PSAPPPMGSPPSNEGGGLSDLLSPNPNIARPASRPLAPPVPPATIPPADFAPSPRPAPPPSIDRAPVPPMPPRVAARSGGPVIPTNGFPDIAGAPAPSAPLATPSVPNLIPPARPPAAPVAKAPLIPDVFDFSDLMGPKTASSPSGVKPPAMGIPVDFSDLS